MAVDDRSIPALLPQVVPAAETQKLEIGAVRRDFLEAMVIALLAFSIGLALGVALCISRHDQTSRQEEQQWLS